jgi:hypothetical protein
LGIYKLDFSHVMHESLVSQGCNCARKQRKREVTITRMTRQGRMAFAACEISLVISLPGTSYSWNAQHHVDCRNSHDGAST